MNNKDTLFQTLLKVLPREKFEEMVTRHHGDKWAKKVKCWDVLTNILHGQLTGEMSLRRLKVSQWGNEATLAKLGSRALPRSSLSDALQKRPTEVYSDLFSYLLGLAKGKFSKSVKDALRVIDSSPIQLRGRGFDWVKSNPRIKGIKLHVVYSVELALPIDVRFSAANVNDISVGKEIPIETGKTYCFDKAYFDYEWWDFLCKHDCRFVTRIKKDVPFKIMRRNKSKAVCIQHDWIVRLTSERSRKLNLPIRHIRVKLAGKKSIAIISNDLESSAEEITEIYRKRWQIELFFKWIKSNLKIKHFASKHENGIKIQIIIAIIAYLLMRIFQSQFSMQSQTAYFKIMVSRNLYQPIKNWWVLKIPITGEAQGGLSLC